MKRSFPRVEKLMRYRRALIAAIPFVALVWGALGVRSQDATVKKTLPGQTRSVVVTPNSTTDAGDHIVKPDSDNDGMPDDAENANGTDPNDPSDADADNDGDGLTNGDEVAGGSGVNNPDSDGDGVSDGEEARLGYSPSDPNSRPPTGPTIAGIRVAPSTVGVIINSLLGQQPAQLTVTGTRGDGSTVDLTHDAGTTYESLNPAVALADDIGQVFGVAVGSTKIEARSGSLAAEATVNVAPFTPGLLSSLQLAGDGNNVDVTGNTAYVAVGSAGLQVIDVSDRRAPRSVAVFDTPGYANDVRVVGTTVYVADGASGLRIIDVSDPAHPALRGAVDTPGDARDVVVYGTRAYVADGASGLEVIDVSNPAAPVIVRTVDTPGTALGVDVAGDKAVVAEGYPSYGVRVIDLSDLAAARIVGEVNGLNSNAEDVVTRGTLAYVAGTFNGFLVIDYSTPSNPVIVGRHTSPANGYFYPNDIEMAGNFVLAAEMRFTNSIPVDDVSDPTSPVYRGALDFTTSGSYDGRGIALDPLYVYMTAVGSGSRLFIAQYQTGDTQGVPPAVNITAPSASQTFLEGQTVTLAADASDDVGVLGVQFTADGANAGAFAASAPYRASYVIPSGVSSLTLRAEAYDMGANRTASQPVAVNVIPDPGTTVVGRVVDRLGQPMSNATLKVFGRVGGVTGADGTFSFYAPSVIEDRIQAIAEAERDGQSFSGLSASRPLVVGGVTNLGDIVVRLTGQLAFTHREGDVFGNTEIYVLDTKSGNKTRLTSNTAREFEAVYSPDGTKIAFNRDDNCTSRNVAVMNADGTDQHFVSPGYDYHWSPDSRYIAYVYNNAVYVSRPDGSEKRRVTSTTKAVQYVSWSPDGSKLAYLAGDINGGSSTPTEVNVINSDGTGNVKLTSTGASKSEIAWSPDGGKIAYAQRATSSIYHVYVVSPAGGAPVRISTADAYYYDLAWAPDGTRLLVVLELSGVGSSLYWLDPAGGAPRRVTNNGFSFDWGPSISQDGSKIVYAGGDGLFVVNWDGTDNRLVSAGDWDGNWRPEVVPANDPGTTVAGRVVDGSGAPVADATIKVFGQATATTAGDGTFSVAGVSTLKGNVSVIANATLAGRVVSGFAAPASPVAGGVTQVGDVRVAEKVIFISDRDGKSEIYLMDSDGSNQQLVTSNGDNETHPALSPDRTRIAYGTDRDGHSEVYVANLDGTSAVRVTAIQNSCSGSYAPAWSPDGNRIAFSASPTYNFGSEIYVVNADGTGLRRLTFNGAYNSSPAWSADGLHIAFTSYKNGPQDLYFMDADGNNQTRVTVNNLLGEQQPTWSPDGTKLAFSAWQNGYYQIYVVNTDGTNQVQLTSGSANNDYPAWSPDGSRVMFSTDRDGNYELYTMNPDGSDPLRLTVNNAGDFQPNW